MRIDHCPKCRKAGLRWKDAQGKLASGLTPQEEYAHLPAFRLSNATEKWCPRCKEWVKP